ncbi:hypothetical protein V1520DRAFT_358470 [Lipomyces starkeyi]|uniref:beta-glucosidase n=1 Tax=Lipomyces starkeyi NRRL Y-11557 TaxID=675824 RepID=A0A1E3Q8F3_LIPST|nr:hypothetical protein LIPSTDRAFT_3183 [Lipomyces starkeyi NRRL Y-11557]
MPGPSRFRGPGLIHAVTSKKKTANSGIREKAPEFKRNPPGDQVLLRRAAAESIVLLKNDDAILPLDPTKKALVLGPNADIAVHCGGGSASLPGYYAVTPFEGSGTGPSGK